MFRTLLKLFVNKRPARRARVRTSRLCLETLEERLALSSATLTDGILRITGTDASEYALLRHQDNEYWLATGTLGSGTVAATSFRDTDVRQVVIDMGGGHDVVRLEQSSAAVPVVPVLVSGGAGSDFLDAQNYRGPVALDGGADRDMLLRGPATSVPNSSGDDVAKSGPTIGNPVVGSDGGLNPWNLGGQGDGRFGGPRDTPTQRRHRGFDISAAPGTPVVALDSGRVIAVGYSDGIYRVMIAHKAAGYTANYMHLLDPRNSSGLTPIVPVRLRVGDRVTAGQTIGHVALRGTSGLPAEAQKHLHLQLTRWEPVPQRDVYLVPQLSPSGADPVYFPTDVEPAFAALRAARAIENPGGEGETVPGPTENQELALAILRAVQALEEGTGRLRDAVLENLLRDLGVDLPLVEESLPRALDRDGQLTQFLDRLRFRAAQPTSWETLAEQLRQAGYQDVSLGTNGEVLRATFAQTIQLAPTFRIAGRTLFDYFDNQVNGALDGSLTAGPVSVALTMKIGVDAQGFFLDDSSNLTLTGVNAQGAVSTTEPMSLRWLANVTAQGTAAVTLSGRLTLRQTGDDKLRLSDLNDAALQGEIAGGVTLNVNLAAHFPLVGDLSWAGTFRATVSPTGVQVDFNPGRDLLAGFSTADIVRRIGGGLLNVLSGSDVLSSVRSVLTTTIPFTETTLADQLGLGTLKGLLAAPGSFNPAGNVQTELEKLGFQIPVLNNPGLIVDLIQGNKVELISWSASGRAEWATSLSSTLAVVPFALGPIPFGLKLAGFLEPNAFLSFQAGAGFDTTGFFFDPTTNVTVGAGIRAGIRASLSLAGFLDLAKLEAGAGVSIGARVGLRDPNPTDGRLYLDELFRDGDARTGNFLDRVLDVALVGGVNGFARGVLSLPWPLPDITLFDEEFSLSTYPSVSRTATLTTPNDRTQYRRVRELGATLSALNLPVVNGTLVLDGIDAGAGKRDEVYLSRDPDGKVRVVWYDRGVGSFAGVERVRFNGRDGNDSLRVSDDFNLPIEAFGGAGDDLLQGGTANDSFFGEAGNDTLEGRAGSDRLHGGRDEGATPGSGNDTIRGGSGNDWMYGGDGRDHLYGEANDDRLFGGDGCDILDGGADHDVLDGGAGEWVTRTTLVHQGDILLGGFGNDVLVAGAGNDFLAGGTGNDELFGGGGNDELFGDAPEVRTPSLRADGKTEYVAAGKLVSGEPDNDLLYGGAGDDYLDGGADSDRLFGDDTLLNGVWVDGGKGNDELRGGAGADVVKGHAGDDRLLIDFEAGVDNSIDELSGGQDRDLILVAGSQGNDWLELIQTDTASFMAIRRDPGTRTETGRVRFSAIPKGAASQLDGDIEQVGLAGRDGNDQLLVTAGVAFDIVLDGGAGDDELRGGAGYDLLIGGTGQDRLFGGKGNDELFGDAGPGQAVQAGAGDYLDGEEGDDRVYGQDGNDEVRGGGGHDLLDGGTGDDTLRAGPGVYGVAAYGGDGDDRLFGGDGVDVLWGGAGNDLLVGYRLIDILHGEGGNDTLVGGTGSDFLFGGSGNDLLYAEGSPSYPATLRTLTAQETEALIGEYRARKNEQIQAVDTETSRLAREALYYFDLRLQRRLTTAWTAQDEAKLANDLQADQLDRQQELLKLHYQLLRNKEGAGLATPDELALKQQLADKLTVNFLSQICFLEEQLVLIDTLDGGDNDDELFGSDRADMLLGNAGDDVIHHSRGADVVSGGQGGEVKGDVYVADGTDAAEVIVLTAVQRTTNGSLIPAVVIDGVEAARLQETDIEIIRVDAGGGDDRVTVRFGNQAIRKIEVRGGAGNDTLNASGLQTMAYLYGDGGNDTLTGGDAGDWIEGGLGDDRLFGQGGADTLIDRDGGSNWFYGGAGNDTILFGTADATEANYAYGGAGNDTLDGSASKGQNFLSGEGDNDTLIAGAGADVLHGGDGQDTLRADRAAAAGTHYLLGDAGADALYFGTVDAGHRFRDDDSFDTVNTGYNWTRITTLTPDATLAARAGEAVLVTTVGRTLDARVYGLTHYKLTQSGQILGRFTGAPDFSVIPYRQTVTWRALGNGGDFASMMVLPPPASGRYDPDELYAVRKDGVVCAYNAAKWGDAWQQLGTGIRAIGGSWIDLIAGQRGFYALSYSGDAYIYDVNGQAGWQKIGSGFVALDTTTPQAVRFLDAAGNLQWPTFDWQSRRRGWQTLATGVKAVAPGGYVLRQQGGLDRLIGLLELGIVTRTESVLADAVAMCYVGQTETIFALRSNGEIVQRNDRQGGGWRPLADRRGGFVSLELNAATGVLTGLDRSGALYRYDALNQPFWVKV